MTDTDPHRVDSLLAQVPGPVRLTPSPRKWLLFIAGSVAFCAIIGGGLLRNGGVSIYTVSGWLLIAIFAFILVNAIGNLVPGVAHLKLDTEGFETKTLFGAKTVPWKNRQQLSRRGLECRPLCRLRCFHQRAAALRFVQFSDQSPADPGR